MEIGAVGRWLWAVGSWMWGWGLLRTGKGEQSGKNQTKKKLLRSEQLLMFSYGMDDQRCSSQFAIMMRAGLRRDSISVSCNTRSNCSRASRYRFMP